MHPANDKKYDSISSIIILLLLALACITPFLNKAFHVDDPLFLWVARHIQSSPFNFYGFTVNWYGHEMPMFQITKNPPLASYYIALGTYLFGWAEVTLHLAFLIPALAVVFGTYYLARELCSRPLVAVLAGILTPGFLLSSTTVMCDIIMLATWVWAIFFWVRGLKNNSALSLVSASLLIAFCSLTKYYGMSLIPLLFVYSLVSKRRLGIWTLVLLIPVVILCAYQWFTYNLYGKGLLLDAAAYASDRQNYQVAQLFLKALTGLSFTGGCFIVVLFYSLLLWRWRTLAAGSFLVLLIFFIVARIQLPNEIHVLIHAETGFNWPLVIQFYLFTLAGISILMLVSADLWRYKDADSLLLFMWVIGTFIFASFLNWSVNGRSVLPLSPALGVLLVRRIQQKTPLSNMITTRGVLLPLVPSLLVALSVTWADYKLADTARIEAAEVSHSYMSNPGTVWFQGHWGFQYYMEAIGGKALDFQQSNIERGDIMIIPSNNSNVFESRIPVQSFRLIQVSQITPVSWLTTISRSLGAGFYSDLWGPLPFVVGSVPVEKYYVLLANEKITCRNMQCQLLPE
jgi:4-amino-4-deoxy-L-arabinose transferase-like glycosyltransferase